MADNASSKEAELPTSGGGSIDRTALMRPRNLAPPILLQNFQVNGVAAEAAVAGGPVRVIRRVSTLSTESFFHKVAPGLVQLLKNKARESGVDIDVGKAENVLVVINPDHVARVWVDSAAISLEARLKKNTPAGSAIFENDVADIISVWFPDADIKEEDKFIYLFREGFRFGLVFDLGGEPLDIGALSRNIAMLTRQMSYADLYNLISTEAVFDRMVAAGWFPFIEIMPIEFRTLANLIESNLSLEDAEQRIITNFDKARLDHIFERWMTKAHFANKKDILLAGFESYNEGKWIPCLKILLTEIEAILKSAYFESTGKTTRDTSKLLQFAVDAAEKLAGSKDTLFFPVGFGQYLKDYTFGDSTKRTASRNAISHGEAKSDDYTQIRSLQAILTMDQIAFYL